LIGCGNEEEGSFPDPTGNRIAVVQPLFCLHIFWIKQVEKITLNQSESKFLDVIISYSVSIELVYELDDRGSRVRFPAGAGNFSLHHRVQNGSGAHPASYPMGRRGSFRGGKEAGA
jgi:hypothetical protein